MFHAEVGISSTVTTQDLSDLGKIFLPVKLFKGIIIFIEGVQKRCFPVCPQQIKRSLPKICETCLIVFPEGKEIVVATAPIAERLQKISPALHRRLLRGCSKSPDI